MTRNIKPAEFDKSPLYACEVVDRRVVYWMAFDPEYGPESEAQIAWHRREYGADHVRGWEVGLPLPGCNSEAAKRQRHRHERELAEKVGQSAEKAESAALESGVIRNNSGGTTPSPSLPFVTDMCGWCGAELPDTRGGRKRRTEAAYCSNAHRQAAYRQRRNGGPPALFEVASEESLGVERNAERVL